MFQYYIIFSVRINDPKEKFRVATYFPVRLNCLILVLLCLDKFIPMSL